MICLITQWECHHGKYGLFSEIPIRILFVFSQMRMFNGLVGELVLDVMFWLVDGLVGSSEIESFW